MNLILCGLPMTGKTTIARLLTERLGWGFIDTDELIEKIYQEKYGTKKACRQIFLDEGETVFRTLEKEQISSLRGLKNRVIATGGGSFSNPNNVCELQRIGYLLYLKVEIKCLWNRMKEKGIPAYLDPVNPRNSFFNVCQKRIPLYEKAANSILEVTHLSAEEIVETIINQKMICHGK